MMGELLAVCAVLVAVVAGEIDEKRCNEVDGNYNPRTCLDLWCRGSRLSGVYKVYPDDTDTYSVDVYCDQDSDGGGWTVFQRRMDGSVDFYRNWQNYKRGFGDVRREHWLGNDIIHQLLGSRQNELRIDMETVRNERAYAMYGSFSIGNETNGYNLYVANYTGTAGSSLGWHNRRKFSTFDRDQDTCGCNCAVSYHGAWWYRDCHSSNLNGKYVNGTHQSNADGIIWAVWLGGNESLKTTEMKFRATR